MPPKTLITFTLFFLILPTHFHNSKTYLLTNFILPLIPSTSKKTEFTTLYHLLIQPRGDGISSAVLKKLCICFK